MLKHCPHALPPLHREQAPSFQQVSANLAERAGEVMRRVHSEDGQVYSRCISLDSVGFEDL